MSSQEPPRRTRRLPSVQDVTQAEPSVGAPWYVPCQQSWTHCHTLPCMSYSPKALGLNEPTGAARAAAGGDRAGKTAGGLQRRQGASRPAARQAAFGQWSWARGHRPRTGDGPQLCLQASRRGGGKRRVRAGTPGSRARPVKVSADRFEGYLAAPGYKALAQSTTKNAGLGYYYGAATLELAKEGAITACKKYIPGHICKIVDPPDDHTHQGSTTASNPQKPDYQDTTTSIEARPNEEVLGDARK